MKIETKIEKKKKKVEELPGPKPLHRDPTTCAPAHSPYFAARPIHPFSLLLVPGSLVCRPQRAASHVHKHRNTGGDDPTPPCQPVATPACTGPVASTWDPSLGASSPTTSYGRRRKIRRHIDLFLPIYSSHGDYKIGHRAPPRTSLASCPSYFRCREGLTARIRAMACGGTVCRLTLGLVTVTPSSSSQCLAGDIRRRLLKVMVPSPCGLRSEQREFLPGVTPPPRNHARSWPVVSRRYVTSLMFTKVSASCNIGWGGKKHIIVAEALHTGRALPRAHTRIATVASITLEEEDALGTVDL